MKRDAATNPFPGLRPFREDEEHLFFGREAHVDQMVDTLARTGFLAVVGSSGSGKSSLVSCGLVPALHRGLLAARPGGWRVAVCCPGNQPVHALAQALAAALPPPPDTGFSPVAMTEATLRACRRGLLDAWREAGLDDDRQPNLLVVVDQFEELFRYRALDAAAAQGEAASAEAVAFVNLLLEVSAQAALPVAVVITMRSDFLGECAQFQGLPEAINRGQFLVPRMTRDERRSAIRGPLAVCGAAADPVLLNRLVNDVGDNPDQLSILQHALNRTWARWQAEGARGPLTCAHYDAVGTMEQALDRHADEALAELREPQQRALCETVFRAITDRGTDARGVRRPTRLDTLCEITGASPEALAAVMAPFRDPARAFLKPAAGAAIGPATPVDISHESLMRVWKQLRQWTEAEARSARVYRRLCESAELHAAGGTQLLGSPELQVALAWRAQERPNRAWAERYRPGFDAAMRFLDDSLAHFERQQQEQERKRLADAEDEARRRREQLNRAWRRWVVPAAAAMLGLVVLLWLDVQRQRSAAAIDRAKAEEAMRLAAAERALAASDRAEADAARVALRQAQDANARQLEATRSILAAADPRLAAQVRTAVQQVQARPLVYLQFADERQRATMQALRPRLAEAGYDAPGMEKVRSVPRQNELRYFRPEDAADAAKLAQQLGDWGLGAVTPKLTPGYASAAKRAQLELWLALPAENDALTRLARQLDSPDQQERLNAGKELQTRHRASPDAIAAVLGLLSPDQIGLLGPDGRINALSYLTRTEPQAWTDGLVQTAREALARIDAREKAGVVVGAQTRAEMLRLQKLLQTVQAAR